MEELRAALLGAEAAALPLMDGAPRNSTDAQMAAWPRDPSRLMPSARRDPVPPPAPLLLYHCLPSHFPSI